MAKKEIESRLIKNESMSKSRSDIETLGIDRVREVVRKCKHLSPHLNDNEKSLGYDGYVSIVKEPSDKIEDVIGRVFVQVKTRTKKSKQFKEKTTFNLQRKYVEFYLNNSPLILFVVHVFDGDSCCIFYKELDKVELYNLSRIKKDSVPLEMMRLNKSPEQLDDLFLCFLGVSKVQERIEPKNQINLSELSSGGYKAHLISKSFYLDKLSLFDRINDGNVILFGEKDNILYHVNRNKLKLKSIKTVSDCSLAVNGKVFFSQANVEYSGNVVTCNFSDSLQIVIGDGDLRKVTIKYHFSYYLQSQTLLMRFLLDLNRTGQCCITIMGKDIPCIISPLSATGLIDYCRKQLPVLERMQQLLASFHVHSDLDLSQVDPHEFEVACQIQDSLENGTEVEIKGRDEDSILVYADIGAIKLAFLAIKQQSGNYRIWDELGSEKRRNVILTFPEENRCYMVPIESCFKDSLVWSCANFNRDTYLNTLSSLLKKDSSLTQIINDNDFLNILRGYDVSNNETLLDLALCVNTLLHQYGQNSTDVQLNTLNRIQVLKRQRALSEDERNILVDILSCSDISYKIAALLLLDREEKASELLLSLDKEDQESFMSYPISRFFSNKSC